MIDHYYSVLIPERLPNRARLLLRCLIINFPEFCQKTVLLPESFIPLHMVSGNLPLRWFLKNSLPSSSTIFIILYKIYFSQSSFILYMTVERLSIMLSNFILFYQYFFLYLAYQYSKVLQFQFHHGLKTYTPVHN